MKRHSLSLYGKLSFTDRPVPTGTDWRERHQSDLASVRPTPPTVTFRDRMKLTLGTREIELIHYGPAHTGGDIVVYLPKEKIVCTGDFYNGYVGYLGDAFVDQWDDALGEFEKHGVRMTSRLPQIIAV